MAAPVRPRRSVPSCDYRILADESACQDVVVPLPGLVVAEIIMPILTNNLYRLTFLKED